MPIRPKPKKFRTHTRKLELKPGIDPIRLNVLINALAVEQGYTVHSNDANSGRFPNVKWVNPLT